MVRMKFGLVLLSAATAAQEQLGATVPPASNPRAHPVTFTASIYQQTGPDQNQNDRGWFRRNNPFTEPQVGTVKLRYAKSVKRPTLVTKVADDHAPKIIAREDDRL